MRSQDTGFVKRGLKFFSALLFCCLLLAGCAAKLIKTVPLPGGEQEQVRARFDEFTRQQCPKVLDADVTLELRFLGKTERAGGMLQARIPSSLRYTTLDPLGRSLFIMVAEDSTFTLVDNRKARAYIGSVDSSYWHQYFPENMQISDLFPLLTGRLPDTEFQIRDIQGDSAGSAVAWLFLEPVAGVSRAIRFDRSRGVILRHLLKDANGDVLLDVVYEKYDMQFPKCPLPVQIEVDGDSVKGTLVIRYDRTFPDTTLSPATFQLTFPNHYTIKKVD